MKRPVYKLVGDMLDQEIERLHPGDQVVISNKKVSRNSKTAPNYAEYVPKG